MAGQMGQGILPPGMVAPQRTTVAPAGGVAPGVYQGKAQFLADALARSRQNAQQGPQDLGSQLGQAINTVGTSYMAGSNERAGQAQRDAANKSALNALAAGLRGDPLGPEALDVIGNEWVDPEYKQIIAGLMKPGAEPDLVQAVGPDGKKIWVNKSQAAGMQSDLPPEAKPPTVSGGMTWDEASQSFKPIPGWLEQQAAIAAAGRAPQQGPQDPERVRLAQAAGLKPGTPEYQNFLLGSSNDGPKPPAAAELRGEYIKATKDYEQAANGYSKVVNAAKDPSPAGDIAMIFGFMKTLDPNSTVREGEFATAQNAGSVPERIAALYNSVVQGTRLTGDQRGDFINQAKGQFNVYQERKKVADQFYSGLAERNQISPQDVLVPYGDAPEYSPTVTPDPGFQNPPPTPEIREGTIIVNPQTKERMIWKGGQWAPAPAS